MNDLINKKVVQHNDLITSVAKMDITPLKFFEIAVASLDISNIPADRTVCVSKKVLYSFFEAKSKNRHTRFKQVVLSLHQQAVFQIREMDEKRGKYNYQIISPLSKTEWNDYNDLVYFKFTEEIMPYLVDLKDNFTQYSLVNIKKLKSKYSVILFRWIVMNYNQYEYYNNKKNRSNQLLERFKNPEISVEELRKLTHTEKSYTQFNNFERRVLKEAEIEINEFTYLNLRYKKIKSGKSITSIQFFIERKESAPNAFYKEEQQDEQYLLSIEEKEKQNKDLYAESMQNNYTKILADAGIISLQNLQDLDSMVYLQKYVFPLYDELKLKDNKRRSISDENNPVKYHIDYLKNHMSEYSDSKKNISRYLLISVEDWLKKI
ncbi:RepB family plasmid replication initiator protein [Listeria welshimeri]|nr:RepB family plasmid replication initiator protein [Listeria welshimeri]